MKKILIINGPNPCVGGNGETHQVITNNLEKINNRILQCAKSLGILCEFIQSNSEGTLVSAIHSALAVDGVILNACEFTHYSIAIRDAISSVNTPVVEIQLVNACEIEEFRRVSMLSPVCLGSISGFGADCYILALYALAEKFGIM